jgi:hypothetical protein
MASDSCAVAPDGTLLDASQILWFNDPDDNKPMVTATSLTAQHHIPATMLDSFFTKVPPAACRSTHASRLSTKAINPNNLIALKRKPSITAMAKPSCRSHHDSPDREEDKATEPELTDTDDDNSVNPDAAYKETKALGDADHKVSTHISSHYLI